MSTPPLNVVLNPPLHPLITRLRLTLPLLQAPMAGVSTPALAAAVSNAGALGGVSVGAGTAAQARQVIEATRALTARPFNVNVFCHAPARRDAAGERAWLQHLAPAFAAFDAPLPETLTEIYRSFVEDDEMLALLCALKPAVVSFHFGLPDPSRVAALRAAGIVLLASVTSLDEAVQAEAAGVDALVAQGDEAGGHRGVFDPTAPDARLPTVTLVQQLVRAVRCPVIAAGGVMDGADLQAMLALGAAAVQMGTAFLLCPEAATTAHHRQRLQSPAAAHTRMTAAISGRPARGLPNRLFELGDVPGAPPPADYPVAYDAAKRLHAAALARGMHDFAAEWAGQGAPRARALPAGELVAVIAAEWAAARAAAPPA
jgi:nitronate monooxygenase